MGPNPVNSHTNPSLMIRSSRNQRIKNTVVPASSVNNSHHHTTPSRTTGAVHINTIPDGYTNLDKYHNANFVKEATYSPGPIKNAPYFCSKLSLMLAWFQRNARYRAKTTHKNHVFFKASLTLKPIPNIK